MHAVAYSVVGRFAGATASTSTMLVGDHRERAAVVAADGVAGDGIDDARLLCARRPRSDPRFAGRRAAACSPCASRPWRCRSPLMALPLAAPFIDMLVVRGGWRWLGAYGVIAGDGRGRGGVRGRAHGGAVPHHRAEAHAARRAGGRRHHRRRLRHRPAGGGDPLLRHLVARRRAAIADAARARARSRQRVWWPARAVLGDVAALAAVLAASFVLLAAAIALVAPRFGDYAIAAAGAVGCRGAPRARSSAFRQASPRAALRRKEWTAAAPRPLARVADADADALSGAAGGPAVARFRAAAARSICSCRCW